VPKKYVEKVGDGLRKAPVGAGPYKFVSFTPGVELVMEAFDGYWRKTPSVKRLVFKSVPEATTRAAMVKNGEVDVAYMIDTPTAKELRRDPNLKIAFSGAIGVHFLDFFDQWDPKSPWADRRAWPPTTRSIASRQRGRDPGRLAPDRQHGPPHLRVRAQAPALRLRSGQGQAAPGRGGLSGRLRRR
jgi:peptide/nickel transport system substrate-binding protein